MITARIFMFLMFAGNLLKSLIYLKSPRKQYQFGIKTKQNGEFVTVFKGGVTNGRLKNAREL